MSTHTTRFRGQNARFDLGLAARRAVVAIAAGAGLVGILSEQSVLSVAVRVGAIAAIGLGAIHVVDRATGRARARSQRNVRGGTR